MKPNFPALKTPDQCASALWGRIPSHIKLTFASAIVCGLAAHLYMFTNKFTNHDDVGSLFGNSYGAASGRWLRPFVLPLSGGTSMPWLVGLMSLLCLAAVACLTVSLLRIRRPLGCIAASAILTTFPVVLSTFTYMYSAFAYFFSLLLAALGAWTAVRWRWWGIALGAVSIALSLSIYQSYLPVAAALMVGALLLEVLDGEHTFKELFLNGVRLLSTLIAGLILYMVSVRVSTGGKGLVNYMGLQDMGRISLRDLPKQIAAAYTKPVQFFWLDEFQCHFRGLKYALALAAVATVVLLAVLLWKKRLGPARTVLAAALFLAFPLAADLIYIMVPNAYVHSLMIYGLCYLLLLPLSLAEYTQPVLKEGTVRSVQWAASWVILLAVLAASYAYLLADNNTYLKLDISMRQCEAYSNRLLERVESCEGYQPDMAVVLVGSDVRNPSLTPTPEMGDARFTGVLDFAGLRTAYTYAYFLRNFLGFPGQVYLGGSQAAKDLAADEQVRAMPCYPADGSVRIVGDAVVVRLN